MRERLVTPARFKIVPSSFPKFKMSVEEKTGARIFWLHFHDIKIGKTERFSL